MKGGSNLAAGVSAGDILAGKYRVERVLGIGGMGVVVAACATSSPPRKFTPSVGCPTVCGPIDSDTPPRPSSTKTSVGGGGWGNTTVTRAASTGSPS